LFAENRAGLPFVSCITDCGLALASQHGEPTTKVAKAASRNKEHVKEEKPQRLGHFRCNHCCIIVHDMVAIDRHKDYE